MSDCQHEWVDDQSGIERMFVCLACGQRLDAGPLTALILKAEQQLGVPTAKIGPVIVMWTGSTYSVAGVNGTFIPSEQARWAGPLMEPPV